MNAEGITTKGGGRWMDSNIRVILQNITYTGNLLLQKEYVSDPITKKRRKNKGELPQYFVEGTHEPIIDMETFRYVQAEMQRRRELGALANKSLNTCCFTGKIKCPFCNTSYMHSIRTDRGSPVEFWVCGNRKKKGGHCPVGGSINHEHLKERCTAVLGLSEFDDTEFLDRVDVILVPARETLEFHLKDGTVTTVECRNTGHQDCWTAERRAETSRKRRNSPPVDRPDMTCFTKKIKCVRCGCNFRKNTSSKADGSKVSYWRCAEHKGCGAVSLRDDLLHSMTARVLDSETLDEVVFVQQVVRMTPHSIANELTRRGIKTPAGKDIWNQATIRRILTNEKYKGDALLQKGFTVDFLTKKQKKNEGEVPQYYIEDDHEAIIEPVVFDMVQMELEKRSSGGRYSGVSIFSSKVKCGQCGGWYGAKVWHSTDKYRKVIYRCNHKYGGEKCRTPHLTEEEIKVAFIKAVNLLLENRAEIAENVGMIRKAVCNTASLEADRDRLFDEMSMLSDLTQTLIAENARVVMNQEDYNRRFDALSKQYDAAKQRHEQVQRQIQELAVRGQQLEQFQRQVFELGAVTEFDEALWGTLVDFITVTAEGEKIVTFRDGTEITV